MKDEEIYTIFDTKKILNKPATVQISKTSGLAGVAYWINQTYCLEDGEKLDKKSPLVIAMKEWVDRQYEDGRQTVMTERELKEKIRQLAPDLTKEGKEKIMNQFKTTSLASQVFEKLENDIIQGRLPRGEI